MTHTDIDRPILALAGPAIINNITVPLLGLCDTAIAGHLGDAASIGAVAVGAMMMNVVYWLCGFLRAGTSGLTAQAFGSGNPDSVFSVLRKALEIGSLISLAVILLQNQLLDIFLYVIEPETKVASLSSLYFAIGVWAAPAQLSVMAYSGWFIGRQNTIVPMVVSVGMNVLNILLSVSLVFGFGMGFAGIAWGTFAASWSGAVGLWFFVRNIRRKECQCHGHGEIFAARGGDARISTKRFFGVSADLFLRSACIMGVSMAMTSVSARLGNVDLAANAVMTQFFLFFSYFMDGFAFAGEALVGKAVGARDESLMRAAVRGLMRWGAWMALAFTLIYHVFGEMIVGLLTDEAGVREAVSQLSLWMAFLPAITVMAFIFDGIFIGWTRTRPLFFTTFAATFIFFILIYLFPGHPAVVERVDAMEWLWTAFEVYLFLRGALLLVLYRKYQRNSLIL